MALIWANVIVNLSVTLMCCLSCFYLIWYHFIIRIGSYIIPFIVGFFPIHFKLLSYMINNNQTLLVNLTAYVFSDIHICCVLFGVKSS